MPRKLAQAVVGYVDSDVAKKLSRLKKGQIDVALDSGDSAVHVRLDASRVTGVRLGASSKGRTAVQLILKTGTEYEIVGKAKVSRGLRRFDDPALERLSARSVINVIYI